jgi:1-acyl-sn-glycerol-3-phosphate acyltransferase
MKKILFWPYQLYMWLILVPLVVFLTFLFSTLTVIFAALVNPAFASRTFAVAWAKSLSYLTPIRVEVEGSEYADRDRSFVVASNHQSMYDILVIYGFLRLDLKWVMKQELRRVPFIGYGCEAAGHIFVERHNPMQARKAIADALEELGDGIGILFFPEGTRSRGDRMLPFKKGAFRTAIDQQLPLLPVTVTGTNEILPTRTLLLFPGKAKLTIHEPIETAGMTIDDVDTLMQETRRRIASALSAGSN